MNGASVQLQQLLRQPQTQPIPFHVPCLAQMSKRLKQALQMVRVQTPPVVSNRNDHDTCSAHLTKLLCFVYACHRCIILGCVDG